MSPVHYFLYNIIINHYNFGEKSRIMERELHEWQWKRLIRLVKNSFFPLFHQTSYIFIFVLPFWTTTAASSSVSSTVLFPFIDAFFTETIPVKFLVVKKKKVRASRKRKGKKKGNKNKRHRKMMNRLASNIIGSLLLLINLPTNFFFYIRRDLRRHVFAR